MSPIDAFVTNPMVLTVSRYFFSAAALIVIYFAIATVFKKVKR